VGPKSGKIGGVSGLSMTNGRRRGKSRWLGASERSFGGIVALNREAQAFLGGVLIYRVSRILALQQKGKGIKRARRGGPNIQGGGFAKLLGTDGMARTSEGLKTREAHFVKI